MSTQPPPSRRNHKAHERLIKRRAKKSKEIAGPNSSWNEAFDRFFASRNMTPENNYGGIGIYAGKD